MLTATQVEMLEQLQKAHDRIFVILTIGFLSGFILGLFAAWVMK